MGLSFSCTCILWNSSAPLRQHSMYVYFFREHYETWNVLSKARNEGRLFSKLKWPHDVELVCLNLPLYSAAFLLF